MSVLDTIADVQVTPIQMMVQPVDEEAYTPKKAERIAACGTRFNAGPNIHNGRFRPYPIRCGCMECEVCRQARADKLYATLQKVAGKPGVMVTTLSHKEASKLSRKLGGKEYRKFPLEDGSFLCIYRDIEGEIDSPEAEPFTKKLCKELDWFRLCVAPKGKRNSGSLGSSPAPTHSKEDKIKVEVFVMPNASKREKAQAAKQAILNTITLNPTTKKTLEKALEIRCAEMKTQLEGMGIHYWTTKVETTLDITKLKWDQGGKIFMEDWEEDCRV